MRWVKVEDVRRHAIPPRPEESAIAVAGNGPPLCAKDVPAFRAYDGPVDPSAATKKEKSVKRTPTPVPGPIRCHKCQLKCRDADHYLQHKCETREMTW
jgi:hypothetical protein